MLKRIAGFIVSRRKMFMIIFAILTIISGALIPFVQVNYDQTVYLPADSDTFRGLNVMKDEFGAPGSMSVMVRDVSIVEASEIRKDLETFDGVGGIVFLDTMLLSMKTDDTQSDEAYLDMMIDMLSMVYRMQSDYFPDRSLGYVYGRMLEFSDSIAGSVGTGGIISDNGLIDLNDIFGTIVSFGDGGQSVSDIDPSSIDMLEGYYKKNCALLNVTFVESDFDTGTKESVDSIISFVTAKHEAYFTGPAASAFFNQRDGANEIMAISIMAIFVSAALLLLATKFFAEPLIYIGVLVVAIILNMGTNIVFGMISNIANLVSALLQLALSMDYSIFLLHSYVAEKAKTPDPKIAMKNALAHSLSPISASSLTTIAGFVALMFMSYRIGLDFGLVLAKGILLSLVTVFLFMPGIVLAMSNILEKTKHRSVLEFTRDLFAKFTEKRQENAAKKPKKVKKQRLPLIYRYSDSLFKIKSVVPFIFIILMIPMFFFQNSNNFFFGEYIEGNEASTYMRHSAETSAIFGRQNTGVVLFSNELLDKEEELCQSLEKLSFVSSVTSLKTLTASMAEEDISTETRSQFRGVNYSRIIISFDLSDEGAETFANIERVEQLLQYTFGESHTYYLLGTSKSIYEISQFSLSDSFFISMLTLLFIFVILIFTYRSATLPFILAIVIQGATWINMAIPYLMGEALQFMGYIIVSAVQMGATIDYGILLTSNYMRYREGADKKQAMRIALKSSFGAILTSSSVLTSIGLALGIMSTSSTSIIMGMALARGTIISTISMLFILPQLLMLFDKLIMKTTVGGKKAFKIKKEEEEKVNEISSPEAGNG